MELPSENTPSLQITKHTLFSNFPEALLLLFALFTQYLVL